ncbi:MULTISPECIES: DUF397 domain-containing protein [Saccharopolyspora]|uniref:DUF397 domain-containing protein n=1 Tax=Saccharopolyspora elongata TaxID=2530387 RepID=A0A4R4Y9W8_9PSEU|nr:DUF397 domain-containing protein [Saccharopolyspora elongata]TDD41203.1 DUF397 domain-containing protein [Saccharopolyspora elongata]
MLAPELQVAGPWRKSSRSNNGAANCVEIAPLLSSGTGVRDSKDPAGPALAVNRPQWSVFVNALKAGYFDL